MLVALAMVWLTATPPRNCSPLQLAVMRNDQDAVQRLAGRRLLGMGVPATSLEERTDSDGPCYQRTPLMLAAEYGQLKSAQILISSGAKLDATAILPELGEGPIDARCLAIVNGRLDMLALLETSGAPPLRCAENATLLAAVKTGKAEVVEVQLRAHPTQLTLKAALLSLIRRHPLEKTAALLIQEGLTTGLDFAPVYDAAISAGDIELVHRLSSGGAKVSGGYLLGRAISLRQPDAIASLIAAGARTDTQDARESILEAVRDGESGILLTLLRAGYRGDQDTPLLLQAVRHAPRLVPELVKAGVAVEIDDVAGTTPLMAAAALDDTEAVTLLLERGASPRTADVVCETAFDAARARQQLADARLLALLRRMDQPPLPGRAARRMGITCGSARLTIPFHPDFEVFLPTGQLPMLPAMEYRVDPGVHVLRVVQKSTRTERKLKVSLTRGLNAFDEKPFDFSGKKPPSEPEEAALPSRPPLKQTLSSTDILEVVDPYRPEISKCIVEQQKRAPKVSGSLVMRWEISTEGDPEKVSGMSENPAEALLVKCLQSQIRSWKFPDHRRRAWEPVFFPFKY